MKKIFLVALLLAGALFGGTLTEMVPMRDGVRLATDIYLPEGKGPWPVVVLRTPYNRKQKAASGNFVKNGYAYVAQDWRGLFASEGKFTPQTLSGTQNRDDGYDTIEWVARQPWSNGKIGITGGSGPGIAAKQAVLANPPHLVAAVTTVAAMFPADYTFYHGGVPLGQTDRWIAARGVEVSEWPKPRLPQFDLQRFEWPPNHKEATVASRIALLDNGGWYDIFCPSTLADFVARHSRDSRVIIAARGHGALSGSLEYPPQNLPESSALEWFDQWLKGKDTGVMKTPPIRYFLMGDTMRPGAPGNVWKQAESWPVPNTPTSYYLTDDKSLRPARPTAGDASLAYAYDPKNPVPMIGGANLGPSKGPMDQRKLRDRKDILRFESEPLAQPLEITGKVMAELYISADVPDTTVMAKLIDIHPNGYEALVLDTALMARYWNGFNKPAPLENGKVYKLTLDLWSTALVFDKGHRIALHVTGSNAPRFEVHPNSFKPVASYEGAPVAHVSVQTSAQYPSRVILPVIAR